MFCVLCYVYSVIYDVFYAMCDAEAQINLPKQGILKTIAFARWCLGIQEVMTTTLSFSAHP